MNILAVDTTNIRTSAALMKGEEVFFEALEQETRAADFLVPMTEEALKKAGMSYGDLDAVAVTLGPASFTSVRIGLAFAKGVCLARDLPLFSFDSLLATAYKYRDFCGKVVVVMDAKMGEFFVGEFLFDGKGGYEILQESKLVKKDGLSKIDFEGSLICGSGKLLLQDELLQKGISFEVTGDEDRVSADSLLYLAKDKILKGGGNDDISQEALYLRQASVSKRKK